MSSLTSAVQHSEHDLNSDSYTAKRLRHASPEHLHVTSRRCFIGPIPEGWLKSHRKSWYKQYIGKNYSSKAATFRAAEGTSDRRQITGLDGLSASVAIRPSFPQPDELSVDEDAAGDANPNDVEVNSKDDEEEIMSDQEAAFSDISNIRFTEAGLRQVTSVESHWKTKRRKSLNKSSSAIEHASSFVTAPIKITESGTNDGTTPRPSIAPVPSFHTAKEFPSQILGSSTSKSVHSEHEQSKISQKRSHDSNENANIAHSEISTTPLLDQAQSLRQQNPTGERTEAVGARTKAKGLVRFSLAKSDSHDADSNAAVRKGTQQSPWRRLRKTKEHPGEIVKMEKMLVRVDMTMQELPKDFDENDSLKAETYTLEKWREFMVVCREGAEFKSDLCLQLYNSRVIPAVEKAHIAKRSTHEIPLVRNTSRVNLYSSLDKTVVLWTPWKKGTIIYILRTRSATSAVEWYTFIRQALGWKRPDSLQISVPDLNVTLKLNHPFNELEASITAAIQEKSDRAVINTVEAEKAVTSRIIQNCLAILQKNPEWSDALQIWLAHGKTGLAWKRYDRLEWIYGANEQKMYGTMAMQRTHELELRSKDHYLTDVRTRDKTIGEPAPIEGFLIRLTSQKGHVRRMGKMYFKRLYFTTHNQYLCYCRPAKALPPPPPRFPKTSATMIPRAREIVENTPLIHAVDPFSEHKGRVDRFDKEDRDRSDDRAYKEAERRSQTMLRAEGYINLSHVIRVQNMHKGESVADDSVESGSDVDFNEDVDDTGQEDGSTRTFDDKRTFELVMRNKLVIRLQAYNEETKREWMHRLRQLIRYWKLRLSEDVALLKSVRAQNLKNMDVDEESEAYLGQFGEKWEVTRSVASSHLYNMCGISCCRAITMAGTLYRKPKKHATFLRCMVILCHGQLLVFNHTLRSRTGHEMRHIQHQRTSALDLANCYIYSGLITESDLLYQNQTFDSNHPGHHALPRVYLEDGWTSTDEDTMTCFVIWQPRSKSWFRAVQSANDARDCGKTRHRLKYVSTLGVAGRSIVFKARSRAERDHWVMNIGMEIERAQAAEEVRVVDK